MLSSAKDVQMCSSRSAFDLQFDISIKLSLLSRPIYFFYLFALRPKHPLYFLSLNRKWWFAVYLKGRWNVQKFIYLWILASFSMHAFVKPKQNPQLSLIHQHIYLAWLRRILCYLAVTWMQISINYLPLCWQANGAHKPNVRYMSMCRSYI